MFFTYPQGQLIIVLSPFKVIVISGVPLHMGHFTLTYILENKLMDCFKANISDATYPLAIPYTD